MAQTQTRKYCCVNGCLKSTLSKPGLSLFKLPADAERRKKWLQIIGRLDLLSRPNLNPTSYLVCSRHFESSVMIPTQRKKLIPDALPTRHVPDQPFSMQSSDEEDIKHQATQTEEVAVIERVVEIKVEKQTSKKEDYLAKKAAAHRKRKLRFALAKIKKEKAILKVVKRSPSDVDNDVVDPLAPSPSGTSQNEERTKILQAALNKELKSKNTTNRKKCIDLITKRFYYLTKWQKLIRNKRIAGRFGPEWKYIALNLHFWSPRVYRNLQTMLELPDVKSLAGFKLHLRPELDGRIWNFLSCKLQALPPQSKYCTICLDKVNLKKHLYYDIRHDEVIGLHNVDGKVTDRVAEYAYVAMLRGVVVDWRQPVAYAFVESIERQIDLDSWLLKILSKLFEIGIKVKAIVSGQSNNFDKFAKDVKKVTTPKPYFEFNRNKIYYVFDVPTLFNCLRNDLKKYNFYSDEKKISWSYIETVYEHQKMEKLHLIPKVRDCHLHPNSCQVKRVKYTAQVFSRSMFAAFNTFMFTKHLGEDAKQTAEFIILMNDLFDVLNSNVLDAENKNQQAFGLNTSQVELLQMGQLTFQRINAKNINSGRDQTARLKTFKNIQVSIQAIIRIAEDLKREGVTPIFTRRLNKEPLDSLISQLQSGENGSEPTAVEFMRCFSKLFVQSMLAETPAGELEPDLYDLVIQGERLLQPLPAPPTRMVSLGGEMDYCFDLARLPEQNALVFVANYLLYKCREKHDCPEFAEWLRKNRVSSNFSDRFNASLSHCLQVPQFFLKHIRDFENVFLVSFKMLIVNKPANTLLALLQDVAFQMPCPCFPYDYLLKLFVRFRIFATMKYNSKCLENKLVKFASANLLS